MKRLVGFLLPLTAVLFTIAFCFGQTTKVGRFEHRSLQSGAENINTVWQLQNSNFPPDAAGGGFSIVSNHICWALGERLDASSGYPGYIRTTDGGNTWVCDSIPGAEGGFQSSMAAIDADTAYVAVFAWHTSASRGIYKTTDGGTTWTKQNAYSSSQIGPSYIYFFDARNGVVVGEPSLETYTTTNGGRDWNPVSMPAALGGDGTWAAGPCIVGYGNRVWFTTDVRVFRSTDRGYTWSASAPEFGYFGWHPYLAFQDSNSGIHAATNADETHHVYRKTTDGGTTWSALSNPVLDDLAPRCVLHIPGTKETYVVAGRRGFACTYDGGNNWRLIDTTAIFNIGFLSDSVGWADSYYSNAVFKYVGSRLITSAKDEIVAPNSFQLTQNYPNPFNPSTAIKYELPNSSNVKLSVFDVLGREVTLLVNERKEAGVHEVKFDATNLSSGVYFYRLHAGDFVQTRRLVVLR
jgi:hypothetical protein